jgi:hypothetical protein
MTQFRRRATSLAAFAIGAALLGLMLRRIDSASLALLSRLFGIGLLFALLPGAAWHVVRTEAWRRCFPAHLRPRFATMFRIRLAAEAFSYLTISGVTGEPVKVLLLAPAVPASIAAAATALERVAYLIVTAAIVGAVAGVTAWAMPLAPRWAAVYESIAAVAAIISIGSP